MVRDLESKSSIYVKAVLFILIGVVSAILLFAQAPTLQNAILLALIVWSFCRAYYFAFYVVERYVDPNYRFSGLISFLRYFIRRQS
jgi:hypothetical protein